MFDHSHRGTILLEEAEVLQVTQHAGAQTVLRLRAPEIAARCAPGVFVHVSGEVEFERADIGFADGSVQSVDAFGVNRDSGLFELASFPAARPVEWVRLVLRARSRNARVGIKLAA